MLPVVDPERGLKGIGDKRRDQHQAGRYELPVAVDDGDDRQRRDHRDDGRGGHQELERERLLERGLLVGLLLLDVLVADAHELELREHSEGDEQYAPYPVVRRGQERREDESPDQAERAEADVEDAVDHDSASGVRAQAASARVDAPAATDRLPGVGRRRRFCAVGGRSTFGRVQHRGDRTERRHPQ